MKSRPVTMKYSNMARSAVFCLGGASPKAWLSPLASTPPGGWDKPLGRID